MDKKEEAIRKAKLAEALWRDPILQEILTEIEADCIASMTQSVTQDDCWLAKTDYEAIQRIKAKILAFVSNGNFAEQSIRERTNGNRTSGSV